jgi:hypothetical protein
MSTALLVAPGLLAWGADAAICAAAAGWAGAWQAQPAAPHPGWAAAAPDGSRTFVRLAYGWLPFVWAVSLAHYTQLFGAEAGLVLPRAADMLHLPASVHDALPSAVLAQPVVAFLQAATLAGGGAAATVLSLHLGRSLGVAPVRVAAQCGLIFAAGAALLPLIITAPFLQ